MAPMKVRHSPLLFVGVLLLSGLVAGVFAGAAGADRARIAFTRAGQAAAQAAVLRRADLGASGGWSGGPTTADLSASLSCPGFQPKQSDLIVNGAARTTWKQVAGLPEIDSVAQVFATARMVSVDWRRSVLPPQVVPCLRADFSKQLSAVGRLVSFGQVAFPALARYARAYRGVAEVISATGSRLSLVFDVVILGRGRTELTLTTIAPLADGQAVRPADVPLAKLLLTRVHA
jgi:hypothetical protein